MSLRDNLPQFIADEKYTKEILDAIQPEIDKIRMKLISSLLECCVTTCSEAGLSRFEKDYSIVYNAELSFDERKRQVINKMLNKRVLTFDELSEFIKRNVNEGQFYISNMAEEYAFSVMITDNNYKEELFNAIKAIRPAHLVFEVKIVTYQRRCNTFNAGVEPL